VGSTQHFLDKGQIRWGNEVFALAIREAVMEVRAKEVNMPLNLAQFVHADRKDYKGRIVRKVS
jgi:hypothetical protein